MRIGKNPNIHKKINYQSAAHRVIIPVYIPNAEGYFKDAFNVFRVCIQSLLKTINNDTKISLISNGSSQEVNDYIFSLLNEGKIDRAIFNKENIGKMNALITETRAIFEEFITYSDADVFFDKGWLKQTYEMFNNVPKAGFVSMNPTPRNYYMANSTLISNWYTVFFKKKKISDICTFSDLEHFQKSIGQDDNFTKNKFSSDVFCVGNENNYIIGAGHFCCTIRKTPTLKYVPKEKSNSGISGGSESIYLDEPADKTGLWRLSSPRAYVWHMGNTLEKDWCKMKMEELKGFEELKFKFSDLKYRDVVWSVKIFPYWLKVKIISLFRKIKIIK